jgi:hypothetical protein
VDALAKSSVGPVPPETGDHRKTDVSAVRIHQASPEGGPYVVGLEIEHVQRLDLRPVVCPADVGKEGTMCVSRETLLTSIRKL